MAIVLPRLYPTLDYGFCYKKGFTCINGSPYTFIYQSGKKLLGLALLLTK